MGWLATMLKLSCVCAVMLLPAAAVARDQWGALAFNNANRAYGFSYNYYSEYDAGQRALAECGRGCRLVLRFGNGCAAYATGYQGAYGWGHAYSRYDAEQIALNECGAHGGGCQIRVWGCNGG